MQQTCYDASEACLGDATDQTWVQEVECMWELCSVPATVIKDETESNVGAQRSSHRSHWMRSLYVTDMVLYYRKNPME